MANKKKFDPSSMKSRVLDRENPIGQTGQGGFLNAFSFSNIPWANLFDGVTSYYEQSQGFEGQRRAYKNSANAFRAEGANAKAIAEYNISLDREDLLSQLDAYGRDIGELLGVQTGQMAATGIDLGSQSFMAITNNTLNNAVRTINDLKNKQKLQAQNRLYEAQVEIVNAENKARAVEHQAELVNYRQRQSRNEFLQSKLSTLFGGLGGLL